MESHVVLAVLIVSVPSAIVLLTAILRGYSITIWRDPKKHHPDE